MKLVNALASVCIASLIGTAGCGGDDGGEPRAQAQLDIVPGCDGGMGGARDAGHDHDHDAGVGPVGMDAGGADAAGPVDPACADLSYATFGEAFVEAYCIGCHLGSRAVGGIDLSTLAGVRAHKDHVIVHAVAQTEDPQMPPDGSPQPSSDEREQLGQWLRCGPK